MDSKHPRLRLGAIALLVSGLLGCQQDSSEAPQDNTLYLNGKIHTQDGTRSQAEAMVVQGGKFTYVGTREGAEALKNSATQVVDLQGKMVLPGLHDNHIHLLGTVALDMCDLDGQSVNLDQLAAKVSECLPRYAPAPGDWLVVNQWSPYDGNTPTATHATLLAALDAAAPNNPVMLAGVDGHAGGYNSQALAQAQDEDGNVVGFNATTLAPGGVFEAFIPYVDLATGVIRDAARSAIAVPDTGVLSAEGEQAEAQYDKILPAISELMASRGITGVQDACANDFIRERMLKMQDQDLLHMRVTAATCFNQDDYSGKLDIDGHLAKANQVRDAFAGNPLIKADAVKIFLDGVLEGALSAAFVDGPLVHPGLEGLPVFPEEMMIVAPYGHAPITRASEVNGASVYAFRANCSYRRHFESWFHADRATPGRIHEMESYHGMLACVIAGAGIALIPRSMLESMPGHHQVNAWPLSENWRWLNTWLVWRRGAMTRQLEAFIEVLNPQLSQSPE